MSWNAVEIKRGGEISVGGGGSLCLDNDMYDPALQTYLVGTQEHLGIMARHATRLVFGGSGSKLGWGYRQVWLPFLVGLSVSCPTVTNVFSRAQGDMCLVGQSLVLPVREPEHGVDWPNCG